MGFFDGIVKGASDVARLPLSMATDAVETPKRLVEGEVEKLGERTAENVEDLMDDAEDTFSG